MPQHIGLLLPAQLNGGMWLHACDFPHGEFLISTELSEQQCVQARYFSIRREGKKPWWEDEGNFYTNEWINNETELVERKSVLYISIDDHRFVKNLLNWMLIDFLFMDLQCKNSYDEESCLLDIVSTWWASFEDFPMQAWFSLV